MSESELLCSIVCWQPYLWRCYSGNQYLNLAIGDFLITISRCNVDW